MRTHDRLHTATQDLSEVIFISSKFGERLWYEKSVVTAENVKNEG